MKPAYLNNQHDTRDRWMVSYLDVMTILLILFVAMAAHSHNSSAEAVQHASTVLSSPKPLSILATVTEELQRTGLDVVHDSRGVVISIPQTLLFGSGEDHINDDALVAVSAIADVLQKLPNNVTLVGHADAAPIHNQRFNNNWELAAARGMRLLELLSSRYGIEESRLSVQSYGSYDPKSPNDTPDGRANNRRVEIVIHDTTPRTNP